MIKNFDMRISFLFIFLTFKILFLNSALALDINLEFFKKFNDKYLEEYIFEALQNNHTLKQANHKVEQYRYEIKSQFSKELPSLSVSSNYVGSHFPRQASDFLVDNNLYVLPFSASYEPDLLLKNRDKTKSKERLYKAQLANQKASYISLLTDVASAYINILLSDFLIKNQKIVVDAKKKNLDYTNRKFKAGIVDSIELNDYRKKYLNQQILYDNLVKNQKNTLYNFAQLIGKSPNCTDEIKRGTIEKIEYIETIPDIINSDLIYNRPDLIEIENKLKSAKIDIRIAKKEFLPTFNITGYLVFDTIGGNFFSWNSSFALLVAGLTQDIFKGGEKIANFKIKKARFKELFEEYKEADLNAIKEVNNALNIIKQDTISEKNSYTQVQLQNKNYNASSKKLKSGVISKVEYYDDLSTLKSIEQIWASTKASRLVDYFTLYKSTGGSL